MEKRQKTWILSATGMAVFALVAVVILIQWKSSRDTTSRIEMLSQGSALSTEKSIDARSSPREESQPSDTRIEVKRNEVELNRPSVPSTLQKRGPNILGGSGPLSSIHIRGLVLDSTDLKPIRGAKVQVIPPSTTESTDAKASVNGTFQLVVPKSSKYTVRAQAESYQDYFDDGLVVGDRPFVDLPILMRPLMELVGTVLDSRSRAIHGASVSLSLIEEDASLRRISHTWSDATGSFSFRKSITRPGRYVLEAARAGFVRATPVTVVVPHQGEIRLYLRPELGPHAAVYGQVTDENNKAVTQAEVILVDQSLNVAVDKVGTNGEGLYRFVNVAKGKYLMRARAENYAHPSRDQTQEVEVEPGQEYRFDFRLDSKNIIQGTVLNEQGMPVSRAMVQLRFERGAGVGAFTSPDGRFNFDNAPSGRHLLKVSHRDYVTYEAAIAPPGEREVKVVLAEGLRLSGVLRDALGGAIENFTLALRSMEQGRENKTARFTAVGGHFELGGLLSGAYELSVQLSNGKAYSTIISLEGPANIIMLLDPSKPTPLQVLRP